MIDSILSSLTWLHAVVLAAVAADVATTIYALKKYPARLSEGNDEAADVQKKLGLVGGSILFKLPMLMIFWPGFPPPAMWVFAGFHAWVAWRNYRLIKRVGQS